MNRLWRKRNEQIEVLQAVGDFKYLSSSVKRSKLVFVQMPVSRRSSKFDDEFIATKKYQRVCGTTILINNSQLTERKQKFVLLSARTQSVLDQASGDQENGADSGEKASFNRLHLSKSDMIFRKSCGTSAAQQYFITFLIAR